MWCSFLLSHIHFFRIVSSLYRDQWFTSDLTSAAVKRIEDVRGLRSRQFAEDAGPLAHPIRPESYISMDNFCE